MCLVDLTDDNHGQLDTETGFVIIRDFPNEGRRIINHNIIKIV